MVLKSSSFFDEDDFQIDMTEKSYSLEGLWIPNGKNPSALIQMIPFNFWIACSSHTQGSNFFGTNWTYVMTCTLLISCCFYLDIFISTLNNKCLRINFSFLSSIQTVVASLLKWCTRTIKRNSSGRLLQFMSSWNYSILCKINLDYYILLIAPPSFIVRDEP